MMKQVRHLLENFAAEEPESLDSTETNGLAAAASSPAFIKRTMRGIGNSHSHPPPVSCILIDDVENEAIAIASDFLVQHEFPLSFAHAAARRCVDQDLSTYLTKAVSKKALPDESIGSKNNDSSSMTTAIADEHHREIEGGGGVDHHQHDHDDEMLIDAAALTKCVRSSIRAYCRNLLSADNNNKNLSAFFDQSFPKPPYEWFAHAVRNTRRKMEDRHAVLPNVAWLYPKIPKADQTAAFAVYDGHGGQECAEYVRSHAMYHVFHSKAYADDDVCQALQDGFMATDATLLKYCERESRQSGTTAVSVIVKDDTVYVAWIGDSRALIVQRNGVQKLTDPPHDTKNKQEVDRVLQDGGLVFNFQGQERVNGLLNITRSLGDLALKPSPLTALPEVAKVQLSSSDACLILASDGLFDGHEWDEVGDLVRDYLKTHGVEEYPSLAKHLTDAACNKTSDNVTIIVVFLQPMEKLKQTFH